MAAFARTPPASRPRDVGAVASLPRPRHLEVQALVAASWAILLVAQLSGTAASLHHHALIEGGLPLSSALPLFLVGWLVMVAAMMLPASLPTIRSVEATASRLSPSRSRAGFLAAFAVVWTAFGMVAFIGDVGLHHVVDATPWLAARPWLIETGILAIAGGWQFTPVKRRSLAACRHPIGSAVSTLDVPSGAGRRGLRHGIDCLGSSWALMLLMFAQGLNSIGWMVGLTALMVYEASGRRGQRAASLAGLTLILAALATASGFPTGGL